MLREVRVERRGRRVDGDRRRAESGHGTIALALSSGAYVARNSATSVTAERAQRLAVIAAGQAHEAALFRKAAIAPVVKAHLERDFGRRRAVRTVERVAKSGRRESCEPFRQFDDRPVREAREHHVVELVQLRVQRRADPRIRMAEEVDPP